MRQFNVCSSSCNCPSGTQVCELVFVLQQTPSTLFLGAKRFVQADAVKPLLLLLLLLFVVSPTGWPIVTTASRCCRCLLVRT